MSRKQHTNQEIAIFTIIFILFNLFVLGFVWLSFQIGIEGFGVILLIIGLFGNINAFKSFNSNDSDNPLPKKKLNRVAKGAIAAGAGYLAGKKTKL